jgi:surface antigen
MSRPGLRRLAVAVLVGLLAGCAATGSTSRSGSVWSRLSAEERSRLEAARQEALERNPSGVATAWAVPGGGRGGEVVPLRTLRGADGGYCRDYRETLRTGGKERSRTGRACRTAAGSWRPAIGA